MSRFVPALNAAGIHIHREADLDPRQRKSLDKYFRQAVFPVLTPMAIDPSHPSPRFHNRGLYLAAMLKRVSGIGPVDSSLSCKFRKFCPGLSRSKQDDKENFVLLEDVIACRLPELFGGYDIVDHATFRLTRDMDINLLEQEADDLLQSIESRLRVRQRTEAVRLEVSANMNRAFLEMLVSEEELHCETNFSSVGCNEVYSITGPLDMTCLFELVQKIERPDLREPAFVPRRAPEFADGTDIFAEIAKHDILLHHPLRFLHAGR